MARAVRANRGDLASQAGLVEGLLRCPQVRRVYVCTYYPHHYRACERVVPLPPPPVRGLLTTRAEAGVLRRRVPVFWGGGVDLQDTGSRIKMPLILLRLALLRRCGSPLVLACQGAGPVRTRFGRFCLRRIVRRFDRLLPREPTAARWLCETGRAPADRVSAAADAALLLTPPGAGFGAAYLRQRGLDPGQPVIGVNLRRWFHQRGGWLPTQAHRRRRAGELDPPMQQLVAGVAAALIGLAAQGVRQVVLMPMYRRVPEPWEDDIALLEALAARLPPDVRTVLVEEDLSPWELLSVFGTLELMVGVRLHSTILAHVAGVPAVHIFYEHKGPDHFRTLGQQDWLLDIAEACGPQGRARLAALLARLRARRQAVAGELRAAVATQRAALESVLNATVSDLCGAGRSGRGAHGPARAVRV